ncbi:unnamed protein product [Clonostachys rosea]|uniref:Protein kinase domain-containing protein n=1 Tax=Bionectria ochroleuca TaxID=29856 RepID=A0ABY6TXY1_BIOOC|nr:unnamed protein product [Clonostachys rosea]
MAELGLAIVATVDLTIKWGNRLVKLCEIYRDSNATIRDSSLQLEMIWLKAQKQLAFMRELEHVLDEHHRSLNVQATDRLKTQFETAVHKLQEFTVDDTQGNGMLAQIRKKATRWKYAMVKETVDAVVEELQKWQALADPSWYLMLKMANSQIDLTLRSNEKTATDAFPETMRIRQVTRSGTASPNTGIFLPAGELTKMMISDIPMSTLQMAHRATSTGVQRLLLTTVECPAGTNVNQKAREVRELARKLSVNDPATFSLLSCKGVIKRAADVPNGQPLVSFTMVFRSPNNAAETKSLRAKMISPYDFVSVSHKITFARQLAKSVAYVHNFGFVHKSIRPENILIFEGEGKKPPGMYLAGLSNFRRDEGRTYRLEDGTWDKDIYLHPQRQGPFPRGDYQMQHDIYSLGVCLLEIGFWESFVQFGDGGKKTTTRSILHQFSVDCQAGRTTIQGSKEYFLHLCRTQLPRYMVGRYCEIVETCLTCLDKDNVDFGDESEFQDPDGILVAVRYIEKVLSRLNEITI